MLKNEVAYGLPLNDRSRELIAIPAGAVQPCLGYLLRHAGAAISPSGVAAVDRTTQIVGDRRDVSVTPRYLPDSCMGRAESSTVRNAKTIAMRKLVC